jgi:radical SAM superfamily enzyme YgiQ (UPF0313 family)
MKVGDTSDSFVNKKPKIVLIFPNPISTIPTGFMYVAKRFRQNGFDTKVWINSFLDFKTMDDYYDIISREKPDVVGCSYATLNLLEIYRLQKKLNHAGFIVVAGGNHPTVCPDEALKNGAHFVVRGEGELAIDDFAKWFKEGKKPQERGGLRSISYIEDGHILYNMPAPRIKDLDSLGNLDVNGLDLTPYRLVDGSLKGLNVILAGRGCPFQCTFCSHREWRQYGYRSVEVMIQDMVERHKKFGMSLFYISDETFSVHRERAVEFCKRLIKEKLGFKWMGQTRVSCLDEELLKLFKESGCDQISIGVESADDYTLKRVLKGYTADEAYNTVQLAAKYQVPLYVNMMTGFPWQTVDSVRNDIQFIRQMGKYIDCFQLYGAVIPYPDTPLYEEYHEKEGFTDFWLRPKYQNAGMCIYQNVPNPYAVSTFWQRNLYDDTYVTEDYFFKFKPAYKRMVAYMGAIIGWHSVKAASKYSWKRYLSYFCGIASRALFEFSPTLEKKIVGKLQIKNVLHQKRAQGRFIKT